MGCLTEKSSKETPKLLTHPSVVADTWGTLSPPRLEGWFEILGQVPATTSSKRFVRTVRPSQAFERYL